MCCRRHRVCVLYCVETNADYHHRVCCVVRQRRRRLAFITDDDSARVTGVKRE